MEGQCRRVTKLSRRAGDGAAGPHWPPDSPRASVVKLAGAHWFWGRWHDGGGGTNLTVANPSQELLRRVPVLLRAQTLLVEKSTQNTMRLPLVIITSISQDPLSLHHIEVSPTPPMPRCAS